MHSERSARNKRDLSLAREAQVLFLLGTALSSVACSSDVPSVATRTSEVVHGQDDRIDYYEVREDSVARLFEQTVVALIPRSSWNSELEVVEAPTLGSVEMLCEGEAFADQPSAAFCSGVLIEQDLVLTAGHCVQLLGLEQYLVVFDYYQIAPGSVAATNESTYAPVEIVAERNDRAYDEPRLDYAFLRLDRRAEGRTPARLADLAALERGAPVLVVSTGGGIPLKADAGGRIEDNRLDVGDLFTATTDTARGGSGAPAFDANGALLGILATGEADYTWSDGCATTRRHDSAGPSEEEFTRADAAVHALCNEDVSTTLPCGGADVTDGEPGGDVSSGHDLSAPAPANCSVSRERFRLSALHLVALLAFLGLLRRRARSSPR